MSVIDTTELRVVAQFDVGPRPRSSAFSPDGARAYVTSENGGSVAVVDTATHQVLTTIALTGENVRPMGVVVSPDGQRVFVTTGRGGSVIVIDTATNQATASIQVGERPWGIAMSPDGRYVYTANGPSNDVSVVDTETLGVVATIPSRAAAVGGRSRQHRSVTRTAHARTKTWWAAVDSTPWSGDLEVDEVDDLAVSQTEHPGPTSPSRPWCRPAGSSHPPVRVSPSDRGRIIDPGFIVIVIDFVRGMNSRRDLDVPGVPGRDEVSHDLNVLPSPSYHRRRSPHSSPPEERRALVVDSPLWYHPTSLRRSLKRRVPRDRCMRGLFRQQSQGWRSFAALVVLFVAVAAYVPSAWHDESQEHTCLVCKIGAPAGHCDLGQPSTPST